MTDVVLPEDAAIAFNSMLDGWNTANGVRFVSASADRVVAEMTVGPMHLQPYGIVHGGVYCGLVETVCSVGAALSVLEHGRSAVGLDNQTSFLHAVRDGLLRVTATPLSRGRRSQLWEAKVESIRPEKTRVVATGRVRLLCLDADAVLAGESVAVK